MIKKERVVTVEGLRDGKGSVEIHHILEGEDLMGHGTMFARVIVKPHSSIGWHQHVGNTEPYYILKGVGTFVDNDGTKQRYIPEMSAPSRLVNGMPWKTIPMKIWK